jgi:Kef-type K+ transport system membrane component KefB
MLAVTGQIDLARLLLDLLIVLVAARLAGEVCERIGVPSVLGEILIGVVIGPSVLHLVELGGDRSVSLAVMAELGVLLLLTAVGMEMDLKGLRAVGATALVVALAGIALPFGAGIGVGAAFGLDSQTAVFLGAALTATSVGITARVLGDLRALASPEARIVLGAAVADDVLGLVILTVVVKTVSGDDVGVTTVLGTLGIAGGFLVATGVVGLLVVPRVWRWVGERAGSRTTIPVMSVALMIGFAALADAAELAFIVGAFMAGLALGATEHHARIEAELGSIASIFVPVFFVSVGVNADLAAMADPEALGLAAALFVVAVAGKLVSGLPVRGADRLAVGIGMIPRGEVGLIFASIGLTSGVLDATQYGALIAVVLGTTVITPPWLKARWRRHAASTITASAPPGTLDADRFAAELRGDLDADARPIGPWSPAHTSVLIEAMRVEPERTLERLRNGPTLGLLPAGVADDAARRRADRELLDLDQAETAVVSRRTMTIPDVRSDRLVAAATIVDLADDAPTRAAVALAFADGRTGQLDGVRSGIGAVVRAADVIASAAASAPPDADSARRAVASLGAHELADASVLAVAMATTDEHRDLVVSLCATLLAEARRAPSAQ